ncbi:MAG: hypothetical protein ACK5KO_04605 [Arachnia sp.]
MGLELTREELIRFRGAVADFVEVLRQSQAENAAAEERLAGTWDDSFAASFHQRLADLTGPITRFSDADAENYLGYLDEQIAGFGRYLDG